MYLFLDPKRRGEEENLLLGQVAVAKLSVEEFEAECGLAGVIGLVSDLDVEPGWCMSSIGLVRRFCRCLIL